MAGHVELFVKETKKRHRQKAPLHEARNLLEVVGHSCSILEDETLAAYLDTAESLLPWVGDPQLQIDRYDARHLLSDASAFKKRGKAAWSGHEDISEEELDRERYFDLENEPGMAEHLQELEEEGIKRQKVDGAGYRSVAFSYEAHTEPPLESASGATETPPVVEQPFGPVETFRPAYPVPEALQDKMPTSYKHHQVMFHTAKFVHTHGGQTEIVLRVKQGDNPKFSFLLPEDPLHRFFRFMVENYEQLAVAEQAGNGSGLAAGSGPGLQKDAVSLVAAAYGEDEDESEGGQDENAVERKDTNVEGGVNSNPAKGLGEGGMVPKPPLAGTETGLGSGVTTDPARETGDVQTEGVGLQSSDTEGMETEPNVQKEMTTSDGDASGTDVRGEGVKPPTVPAVKFAIAKNPPLAVVRKVKQESATEEVAKVFGGDSDEKDNSAGGGAEGEAKLSVPPKEASSAAETHSHSSSGLNEPLTPGVGEPSIPAVSGPSSVNVNGSQVADTPPPEAVNAPLQSNVNEPQLSDEQMAPTSEPPVASVNVPPAKGVNEPPLQSKRVIEKMVEFIARNGKQFEAAVRKKDGPEGRFPFLVPGHIYHAYYETLLNKALEAKALEDPERSQGVQAGSEASLPGAPFKLETVSGLADSVGVPTVSAANYVGTDSTDSQDSDKEEQGVTGDNRLFFGDNDEENEAGDASRGAPSGLGSDAVRAAVMAATRRGSFGSHTQLAGLENRGRKPGLEKAVEKRSLSPVGEPEPVELSLDRVRAAIMRATRTPSPSVSGNLEVKQVKLKQSGLGIDAVRLAVARATKGKPLSDNEGSGAVVWNTSNGVGDQPPNPQSLLVAGHAPSAGPKCVSASGTHSGSPNPKPPHKAAGAADAVRAAATAAAEEADSSHARLTAAEKKRAERLKRAKMLSAILRETGGGIVESDGGTSGSVSRQVSEQAGSGVFGKGGGMGVRNGVGGVGADVRDGSADVTAGGRSPRGTNGAPDVTVDEESPRGKRGANGVSTGGRSSRGEDGAADVGADLPDGTGESEPADSRGIGIMEAVEDGDFVQLADSEQLAGGSAEEGEIVAEGKVRASPGVGETNSGLARVDGDGMKGKRYAGTGKKDGTVDEIEGVGGSRGEKEKIRELRGDTDESDGERHRRRRHRERRDEGIEDGKGPEHSDGERRRRRRHRTGEDRVERRRRRRERRERRARESERWETASKGGEIERRKEGGELDCESEGGGRKRREEKRSRRGEERRRERAEREEGGNCEDGVRNYDGKRNANNGGGGLPERAGEVLAKGGRDARRTEWGQAVEVEEGRKRSRSSSKETEGEIYSLARHAVKGPVVSEQTAEKGIRMKSGTTPLQDGQSKASTDSGREGKVLEAGSLLSHVAKPGESNFEVPESVRAKVREMLAFL